MKDANPGQEEFIKMNLAPLWVAGVLHHEYLWWNMGSAGMQTQRGTNLPEQLGIVWVLKQSFKGHHLDKIIFEKN